MQILKWDRDQAGDYSAHYGPATLCVYWDTSDPTDPGWAWQVEGPGISVSGPAASVEDGMDQAESEFPELLLL